MVLKGIISLLALLSGWGHQVENPIYDNSYIPFRVERDILLTYNTAVALYGPDMANSLRTQGMLDYPDDPQYAYPDDVYSARIRLWSDQGRNIPYTINDSSLKDVVEDSIRMISGSTKLVFVPRSNQRNYINFVNSGNCGGVSYIGMIGGGQRVTMPSVRNCYNSLRIASGVTQHEILHALGFSHQQSYPNRDNYVRIIRGNIQDSAIFNFEKRTTNIIDSFNLPYDYQSIMHYKSRTFSKNGGYTITKLDGSVPSGDFGGNNLSPIDITKINRLYPYDFPTPSPISPRPTILPTPRPTPFPTRLPTPAPTSRPMKTNTPTSTPSNPAGRDCFTIGLQCVFPFRFRGRTYTSCTNNFDPDNRYWCSTKVDRNGVHVRGNWGYCEQTCRKSIRNLNDWYVDYIEADSGNCVK